MPSFIKNPLNNKMNRIAPKQNINKKKIPEWSILVSDNSHENVLKMAQVLFVVIK